MLLCRQRRRQRGGAFARVPWAGPVRASSGFQDLRCHPSSALSSEKLEAMTSVPVGLDMIAIPATRADAAVATISGIIADERLSA